MRPFFTYLIICWAMLPCAGRLIAQDLHFSQPALNPLALNPALTGVFDGSWRATAAHRSQWKSVPVNYNTNTIGADLKIWSKGRNGFAAGMLMAFDRAGDLGLNWNQLGLQGSYTRALGSAHALSGGFGLSFVGRNVDLAKLKVQNQWNGEQFSPGLPTKEPFTSDNTGLKPSLSAGLNWHLQPAGTRSRADVGGSIAHLNQPDLTMAEQYPYALPSRFNAAFSGAWQLNDVLDLVGYGLWQQMQTAHETVAGAGVRAMITNEPANLTSLQFTFGARFGDALIPALQLVHNNWTVGVAYDINISDFDIATNKRGGIEVAVIYCPIPVPPLEKSKSCPIF
ncbi:MAG: PorP/SprF family type IX secretion system membrane protein [Saprospiraceae bacterium]